MLPHVCLPLFSLGHAPRTVDKVDINARLPLWICRCQVDIDGVDRLEMFSSMLSGHRSRYDRWLVWRPPSSPRHGEVRLELKIFGGQKIL